MAPQAPEGFQSLHADLETLGRRVAELAAGLTPQKRSTGDRVWDIALKSLVPVVIAAMGWIVRLEIRVAALESNRQGETIQRMERVLDKVAEQTSVIDRRLTRVETLVAK